MSLFATKPIESASAREDEPRAAPGFKRVLGAADLTLLGIGAIIGTGIFVLTGQAASGHSGPAVVLSMIVAGVASALAATIIVPMMAQPRIFLAMSRDGLLPAWASTIHPRYRTPHVTTLITSGIVIVASGFTSIGVLGELVSIGTLFAFMIVSIGVIVLRTTRPDLERPFRTPFVPVLPIASALVSFALMLALPWPTWQRLIIWMALGLVIYFAYGRSHSKLRTGTTP